MPLGGPVPRATPVLALHGWVAFIDEASMAWLEHRALARVDLREMLVHQFVAILTMSGGSRRL